MKKQFILLAVVGLVLTSCGIYTKYQRPEDITTDGLFGHDLDGQSLDSLSLFAASDTASIASLSWRELFTLPGGKQVGGMFIGTLALLFIVPVLFISFQWLQERLRPAQSLPTSDWQIEEEMKVSRKEIEESH